MATATACLFLSIWLIFTVVTTNADSDEARSCSTYTAKLTSIPDLTHNIVYQGRRHQDFVIEDVKSTNYKRSYYWCQLDIKGSDNTYKRYRHFGFNTTHWWVEKGCGGWFVVTECMPGEEIVVQGIVGLPADSDPASAMHTRGNTDSKEIIDSIKETAASPVDALYQGWPKLGYRFPTSKQMWDMLDKATYVDVPEQLGFYNKFRKPRSVAFD